MEELVADLLRQIQLFKEENAALKSVVFEQSEKIEELLRLLAENGVKKTSRNSSNPPSKDIDSPKRNQSLREESDRKVGGQPGHEGSNLGISPCPDEIEDLKPDFCTKCGQGIAPESLIFQSSRQVIDIPVITPFVKEYRQYSCSCSCGHHQKSTYPEGVNTSVQYGENITALTGCLSVYQYIPYERMADFCRDILNLPISQGTLANMFDRLATKALPFYEKIQEQLFNSLVIGSDETGCKVDGERYWIWVWQNADYTYLKLSDNRGKRTIEEIFPEGMIQTTLVSDRYPAHLNTQAAAHQLCLAHLQRELNYLEALEKLEWSKQLKALFTQAIKIKNTYKTLSKEGVISQELNEKLNELLATTIDAIKAPKTFCFQKSLIKLRNYILPFLYHPDIPPDNNASERAIRNVKVKQKVSGQFKSSQKAEGFVTLRSIADTLKKQGKSVFEAFMLLAQMCCSTNPHVLAAE